MADWKDYYQQHLKTMDEVVGEVKSGDALWFGAATEIPYAFLEKLHDRQDELEDVTLLYNVMNTPNSLVFDEEAHRHFNFVSMFCLPLERMAAEYGNAPFHSCPFEFIPRTVSDVYGCNTIAINVCPPDADGYVNLGIYGISTSILSMRDPCIAKKIAIIDRNQPAAGGSRENVCVKLTDFDEVVECDSEPMPVPGNGPTALDEQIASYVVPFIHDGDKLQIGYGGLGDAILAGLQGKIKHLDIYSEVCSESMQPLVESGGEVDPQWTQLLMGAYAESGNTAEATRRGCRAARSHATAPPQSCPTMWARSRPWVSATSPAASFWVASGRGCRVLSQSLLAGALARLLGE